MKKLIFLSPLLVLVIIIGSCSSWRGVQSMYLDGVWWGGRAVAVTVDPTNDKTVFVATETGGIFRSVNGGTLWSHVDEVPSFDCFDIRFCPSDPSTIIATFHEDLKTINGGGIWVSKDAGKTWEQPASSIPLDAAGNPRRINAYGICFQPLTENVYVGTDSGIAVSRNLGVTWSYIYPNPGIKDTICSIVPFGPSKLMIYGSQGIRISDETLTAWTLSGNQNEIKEVSPNALAVSPKSGQQFFFCAEDGNLMYTIDGGVSWKSIKVDFATPVDASRRPFVRVTSSATGKRNELELYCSSYSVLARKSIEWLGNDFDFSNPWVKIPLHHSDPSDIAFAKDGVTPLYETDDGGVSRTPVQDDGLWEHVGNAINRFNALQIYNVKGVLNKSKPAENNLYFTTQDNNIWASGDNGHSWPKVCCAEGINVQGPADNSINGDVIFTAKGNNKTVWYKSGPVLQSYFPFTKPPRTSSEPVYVRAGVFFVYTSNNNGTHDLNITRDAGFTWERVLTIDQLPLNYSLLSGPPDNPSIFTPVSSGSIVFVGGTVTHSLLRIDNVFNLKSADESVTPVKTLPGLSFSLVNQQFDIFTVFGVDPNDPNYIILPDASRNEILYTPNGGDNWYSMPALLNMVTASGKYFFQRPSGDQQGQVCTIDFDPFNSKRILIGNVQSGVIFSNDRGATWSRIGGSEALPNVYSFFFYENDKAIASTFGRGLWKIRLQMRGRRNPPPPKGSGGEPLMQWQGPMAMGNKQEAHRRYYDTTNLRLDIVNGEGESITSIGAGTKSRLLIYDRTTGKLELSLLKVILDDGAILVLRYDKEHHYFFAEMPVFKELRSHTIKVFRDHKLSGIGYINVVPVDNEQKNK